MWQARKWRHELDSHLLSPMWDGGAGCHFYVNELAEMKVGLATVFVIPLRWVTYRGEVYADAMGVTIDSLVGSFVAVYKVF